MGVRAIKWLTDEELRISRTIAKTRLMLEERITYGTQERIEAAQQRLRLLDNELRRRNRVNKQKLNNSQIQIR